MTLQQTPEKRPKKIDLNLLPAEYLPTKKSKLSIILVLVTVLLICSTVPAITAKTGVDSDIKPLQVKLTGLDATLKANLANNAEAVSIENQITDNISKLVSLNFDYYTFVSTRLIWSKIIEELYDITPRSRIDWNTVTLSSTSIQIDGTATKRIYIIDYETAVEASPFFKGITFSFEDNAEGEAVNFKITAPFDMAYIISDNNASISSK